jgi:imidazolonepropionase
MIDIDIIPTFLGAHAVPPEYHNNKSEYINIICNEMIPEIADKKLATFCDVFCEPGYFNIDETKRILNVAKKYNLTPRIHADEFIYSGGSKLAAEINAISADHLMSINDEAIKALSESNTIATLLPGTTFFLGDDNYADGRKMIDNGCSISLASDFNPGTCTIRSLSNIMHLAMQKCGLSLDEAFLGVTYNAAMALGLNEKIGLIKKDYNADLILWELENLSEIPYWFDASSTKIVKIFKNGKDILG